MIKRFMKLFVATTVILSILLSIVPDGIYAASAKSGITIKVKSKIKKVKKIKKSKDGKISILDGPMMGPSPKEVGKPKPLKFKIDFDNYDLKFTDVPKDHPYYKGIVWAVENGIIKNEEREFKPDETIEMREFLMAFFNTREKYHQEPLEKMLSNYKEAADQHWILNKYVLTTDMPEARGIHPLGVKWNVAIFTPTKLKKFVDSNQHFFSHLTYNPKKKINKAILYYAHGTPDYLGYLVRSNVGWEFVGSYNYLSKLSYVNSFSFYKALVQNEKLSKDKKFKKVRQDSPDHILPLVGIQTLQRVRMFNIEDPTLEELELEKEVSRAEFYESLYRVCRLVKSAGLDYRIDEVKY